ncbi:MAG: NAD(P)/FAD-dependent oxidoreductase [Anaerolineaceae bacterium]|nr:NAD(P)/FAD-dependent oxidoreductase [Anaerolineaceae bacterium]
MMRIAIIGAGVGGLSAAHDLNLAGHDVTIYEAADYVGGLVSGFKEPHWNTSVEKYYHHWFASDDDMLGLLKELGLDNKVVFYRPQTVVYHKNQFFPLDSPLAALTFPGFKFLDMVRFGLVTIYLRYLASWKPLEKVEAEIWMKRYYGERLYQTLFQPLLMGKFGPHYQNVNMAWFWARFKVRTPRLGTFEGGFQQFADDFADILRGRGVSIQLNTPVERITALSEGGLEIKLPGGAEKFDRSLVTVSPGILARLAPDLAPDYLKGLLKLKSLGAVVMVLALRRKLSRKGYYWFNLPKSAEFPFLALVEHTNFLKPEQFGGDHIVYCGDYLETEHENFQLTKAELLKRFLPSLKRFNSEFTPEWVRESWLFRANYAQPVPLVNHSANIPEIRTPLPGLYFASMSQVYPWDRGTNFAVQIARKAAKIMQSEM